MKKYLLVAVAVSFSLWCASAPRVVAAGAPALGGLLETITPVTADDGWGGTVSLDTRAWSITISVVPTLVAGIPVQLAADPVVVTLVAQTGKMLDADTFKAGGPAQRTTLTRSEVKALNNVTLASLIAAAKVKLGLT